MKVLITGATGFLGRHVCRVLVGSGHEIRGTSANRHMARERPSPLLPLVPYRMGDALPVDLIAWGPEVIVHLAWEGIPDYSPRTCRKNLRDQIQFFERVCPLPSVQKVVATGSCWEYGDATGACSEESLAEPTEVFGRTKTAVRRGLERICGESGIGSAWLRIFYAYGPGQRSESLIPFLVASIEQGEKLDLRSPGMIHDFVNVEDVALAVLAATERSEVTGVFNVGSGLPTMVSDLARIVRMAWLGEQPAEGAPFLSDVTEAGSGMWADLSRSRELMGWLPQVDLFSGVAAMVQRR